MYKLIIKEERVIQKEREKSKVSVYILQVDGTGTYAGILWVTFLLYILYEQVFIYIQYLYKIYNNVYFILYTLFI